MPKRTPFNAVRECSRDRAPPAPEGTPLQERQTCSGPPSAPPLLLDDEGPQRWQIGVRRKPSMTPESTGRCSLPEESPKNLVGISELEHFLLSAEDDPISIFSFCRECV